MTRTEHTTFPGSGGDQLSVRLDLPDGEPVAYALFAHCFTCSKDVAAAPRISRGLVERGFGVLRFDFTGLGSSGGEFANTTFSSDVEDLVRAAAMLRERYIAPTLLVGHSLGGAAVLAAARAIPEATAVATIGAPFDPGIDDASAPNLTTALQNLGRALLVLHSARDEIVGIDNARRIFAAAGHPKSFVSLDEADHLLHRPEDATYVADVLASWASRYLPTTRSRPAGRIELGTVVVAESGVARFGQTIRAGRHRLVADEPVGVGDDAGPTPYDLLLAALGACTSMTIRMYADRKGWALDHVSVQLTHDRVHTDDCREQIRNPCTVDHIDRTLELTGVLTEQQRARLLTIAERCPRTAPSPARSGSRPASGPAFPRPLPADHGHSHRAEAMWVPQHRDRRPDAVPARPRLADAAAGARIPEVHTAAGPVDPDAAADRARACSSGNRVVGPAHCCPLECPPLAWAIVQAALIRPMWLKACGKLPSSSPLSGSISSASRPTSLAWPAAVSNTTLASSTSPARARHRASQNVHSRKVPSAPVRPSSVSR
jgi:uncharacterized OsmC-like protein/alpha/beta superfamily hydrolase